MRQYSLGMRQRLGLAHALLGDPEVLILDEPANGLDPEGMRWMRGLLRDFADRGGTVLLSSHLLGEVQAVADRIVIIGAGSVVAQGARDELLADTGTLVSAADHARLALALRQRRTRRPPRRADGALVVDADSRSRRARRAGGRRRPHPSRTRRGGGPRVPVLRADRQGGRMSAATIAHPAALAPRSLERPGLARLTAVELRKMTDTRAGFWLQVAVVALTVVVVAAACLFAHPEDQTLRVDARRSRSRRRASCCRSSGILLVTSEWSQRTGLTTFALVPRRGRVVAAKLLASVVLSLVALVLCIAVAVIGDRDRVARGRPRLGVAGRACSASTSSHSGRA